jgi:hypothetical protein
MGKPLTEEQKAHKRAYLRAWRAARTPEQRERRRAYDHARRAARTPEQKEKACAHQRARWAAMPSEQKAQKITRDRTRYIERLTGDIDIAQNVVERIDKRNLMYRADPANKERQRAYAHAWWAARTPEQKEKERARNRARYAKKKAKEGLKHGN